MGLNFVEFPQYGKEVGVRRRLAVTVALLLALNLYPTPPALARNVSGWFSSWQEYCDSQLRRGFVGGRNWNRETEYCRRVALEQNFPYMDLLELWLSVRFKIGEQVEKEDLVPEEANARLDELIRELNARIQPGIHTREAAYQQNLLEAGQLILELRRE